MKEFMNWIWNLPAVAFIALLAIVLLPWVFWVYIILRNRSRSYKEFRGRFDKQRERVEKSIRDGRL